MTDLPVFHLAPGVPLLSEAWVTCRHRDRRREFHPPFPAGGQAFETTTFLFPCSPLSGRPAYFSAENLDSGCDPWAFSRIVPQERIQTGDIFVSSLFGFQKVDPANPERIRLSCAILPLFGSIFRSAPGFPIPECPLLTKNPRDVVAFNNSRPEPDFF